MKDARAIGRVATGAIGMWIVIECVLLSVSTFLAPLFGRPIPQAISIISWAAVATMLVNAICLSIWSYRAMAQAHRREPTLTISPVWSVGWYLVPIAWYWKPYEAMREIWKGSASDAQLAERTTLIAWWWGAWVVRGVLDPLLFLLPGMPFTVMSIVYCTTSIAGIAAGVLLIVVIRRIAAMNAQHIDASVFD